jgi:hypothetical protein
MYMHVKALNTWSKTFALQREIYDWREEEGKCQSKTLLKTIPKNLKMMWF